MSKVKTSNPFEKIDRETEWSAAATVLADWGNQIIRDNQLDLGPIKVEKVGKDRKRADGLIYKNPRSNQILATIEFKIPSFDPFDENNLVRPAMEKAFKRGAPLFCFSPTCRWSFYSARFFRWQKPASWCNFWYNSVITKQDYKFKEVKAII